jgi:uncharacterized membrane-anchored protein
VNNTFQEVFNLQQLIMFLVIFSICIVGAVAKDVMDGFAGKVRIQLKAIILSALVLSILIWSVSDWVLNKLGISIKVFFGVTVILGMLSYEITSKLTTIDGVKSLLDDYMEYRKKRKK